jgi:hypothetical protein
MDHLDGVLATDRALDRNSLFMRAEWDRRSGFVVCHPPAH